MSTALQRQGHEQENPFVERRGLTRREADRLNGISRVPNDSRWIAEKTNADGKTISRHWLSTRDEAQRLCSKWADSGYLCEFYSTEAQS